MPKPDNGVKSASAIALAALGISLTTTGIVFFASGYRINLGQKKPDETVITLTGLISAISDPKSASVYINDKLATATDGTLSLNPGTYTVKITKDGYLPWQKTFEVKKEVVNQTNTLLFKSAPILEPITGSGAINASSSTNKSLLLFSVASASAQKNNGLFVFDLAKNPLYLLQNNPRQLSTTLPDFDFTKSALTFSPDDSSVLATYKNQQMLVDLAQNPLNRKQIQPLTREESQTLLSDWQKISNALRLQSISRLPLILEPLIATDSSKPLVFNATSDKVIYVPSKAATLPKIISDPLPAQSTQPQSRSLSPDSLYVYDLKDDTNFLVGKLTDIKNIQWLGETSNLIYVENKTIYATDYDSTNKQKLYAGEFEPDVLLTTSDGKRIIVVTNAYPGATKNIYTITVR